MPELPEVETIRTQLETYVVGQTISTIDVRTASIIHGDIATLHGQTVTKARRFSKLLVLQTKENYAIAIHLKMTGRLVFDDPHHELFHANWEYDYPTNPHTHIIVHFVSGSVLYFNDYRRFGTVDIQKTTHLMQLPYIKTLGKEFLSSLTSDDFYTAMQSTGRVIKVVLLDQTKVSGVGNIYANEALWRSKIHPEHLAKYLTRKQTDLLFSSLEAVMSEAKLRGGASSDNFRDLFGRKGHAQDHFDVYGQEGKPCKRCGTLITKYFVGGRGTYVCPKCQKKS